MEDGVVDAPGPADGVTHEAGGGANQQAFVVHLPDGDGLKTEDGPCGRGAKEGAEASGDTCHKEKPLSGSGQAQPAPGQLPDGPGEARPHLHGGAFPPHGAAPEVG